MNVQTPSLNVVSNRGNGLYPSENRVPVSIDPENIGREARFQLFNLLYREVVNRDQATREKKRIEGRKVGRRENYNQLIASMIGVTVPTVKVWKRGQIHSCDANTKAIIQYAYALNPKAVIDILQTDLLEYERAIKSLVNEREGEML